jgi:hypothetical protein
MLGAKGGPGGGHSGGAPSGSHSGAGHAPAGHAPEMTPAGASTTSGAATSGATPSTRHAHTRDSRLVAGQPEIGRSPFLATPSTYAPYFVSPLSGRVTGAVYGLPGPYEYSDPGSPTCAGSGSCGPATAAAPSLTSSNAPLEIINSGDSGDVRLDVKPTSARVFVDGAFVGTIDDYRHTLAGLNLRAGRHRLEFRAPGYETLVTDVDVDAGRVMTYAAELRPLPH